MSEELNQINSQNEDVANENVAGTEELSNNNLEGVSGGYLFHVGKNDTPDPDHRWEVIDDKTGRVLGRYATWWQARREAKAKGVKLSRIWRGSYLKKLRDAWKQHKKYENEHKEETDWTPPLF